MFLNLFRQVEPIMILLDGKTQGAFVQTVRKTVFENDAQGHGNCKLTFLSAREYSKYHLNLFIKTLRTKQAIIHENLPQDKQCLLNTEWVMR